MRKEGKGKWVTFGKELAGDEVDLGFRTPVDMFFLLTSGQVGVGNGGGQ